MNEDDEQFLKDLSSQHTVSTNIKQAVLLTAKLIELEPDEMLEAIKCMDREALDLYLLSMLIYIKLI